MNKMRLNEEQLKSRQLGIGGSDVAAIRGVSPWKTAVQLYHEKVHGYKQNESDEKAAIRKEKGILLEDWLIDKYEARTGNEVVRHPKTLIHPEIPYIRANLDGFVRDPKIVVEIKTSRDGNGFGDEYTSEIPLHYELQVRHYMAVLDAPVAHLFACIERTDDLKLFVIKRDLKKEKIIIEMIERFWKEHIQKKIPPAPIDLLDFKLLYPEPLLDNIEADGKTLAVFENLKCVKSEIHALEEDEKNLKMELMSFMHVNEQLTYQNKTLATWKCHKRESLNTKSVKKDYPELYKKYCSETKYRTFLVK